MDKNQQKQITLEVKEDKKNLLTKIICKIEYDLCLETLCDKVKEMICEFGGSCETDSKNFGFKILETIKAIEFCKSCKGKCTDKTRFIEHSEVLESIEEVSIEEENISQTFSKLENQIEEKINLVGLIISEIEHNACLETVCSDLKKLIDEFAVSANKAVLKTIVDRIYTIVVTLEFCAHCADIWEGKATKELCTERFKKPVHDLYSYVKKEICK